MITAEKFAKAFPKCKQPQRWAESLEFETARVAIRTPRRISHFLAQLSHESAGFTRFEENLRYTTPSRLDAIFSAVKGEADAAALIAKGPTAIANRVYANRNGNGAEATGDGWKYRGMGPIQLTGRGLYAKASTWTGLDLLSDPASVMTPAVGSKVAADYWRVCDLNDEADAGRITDITHAINPALAGLAARKADYQRLRAIWLG